VEGLKNDIAGLKDINIRASGLSAVSAQLTKIEQQFSKVKSDVQGQYQTQVDAMSNALAKLKTSLDDAASNLNGGTLAAVAAAAGSVVTAGTSLVTAVSNTC
jgi:hypothetical protein